MNDYDELSRADYIELPVTGGFVTKVDPNIAEKLEEKKLFVRDKNSKNIYVCLLINKKIKLFHRFIVKAKKGQIVDHINGETLDNRKCNLRICNHTINNLNHQIKPKSISGYWGVAYDKTKIKYKVMISINSICKHCGYYSNKGYFSN